MGPGDPLEREAEARLAARLRQRDLAERLALQARATLRPRASRLAEQAQFENETVSLEPGDRLFFFYTAVVGSLVLCTVQDPHIVVREALRVLGPGGRFICIERVRLLPEV